MTKFLELVQNASPVQAICMTLIVLGLFALIGWFIRCFFKSL